MQVKVRSAACARGSERRCRSMESDLSATAEEPLNRGDPSDLVVAARKRAHASSGLSECRLAVLALRLGTCNLVFPNRLGALTLFAQGKGAHTRGGLSERHLAAIALGFGTRQFVLPRCRQAFFVHGQLLLERRLASCLLPFSLSPCGIDPSRKGDVFRLAALRLEPLVSPALCIATLSFVSLPLRALRFAPGEFLTVSIAALPTDPAACPQLAAGMTVSTDAFGRQVRVQGTICVTSLYH